MAKPVNIQANLQLNPASINSSARQVQQALGRITGQASEFQKSLDASTARVFAFGATTVVINGVTQSFKALVKTTVNVQSKLVEINSILGAGAAEFNKYRNAIFNVAKVTGQSFDTVAAGAAELARQGLGAAESARRLEAALILTRISGLGSAQSVKALTAAMNGFTSAGLSAEQVVNKIVAVDTAFAVSAQDLADGFSRAGSTAEDAGVSFDELLGLITAVEQRTARGGAVIGNAFKSIFTRLSRGGTIGQLQELGVAIDANQNGVQKLKALSDALERISDPTQASAIKELAGGVFQINVVSAALKDIGNEASIFGEATKKSFEASNEATQKNTALNDQLIAQFNSLVVSVTSLGEKLGNLTIGPALTNIIGLADSIATALDSALDPEKGNKFVQGLLSAIGGLVSGPGLTILTVAFLKIFKLVFKFAKEGFKNIMEIGSASERVKEVEAGIVDLLQKDDKLRKTLVSTTISQADKQDAIIKAIRRENILLGQQKALMDSIVRASMKKGVGGYSPSGGFTGKKGKRFAAGGGGQMEPDLMTAMINEAADAPAGAVPYVTNFRGQPVVMNSSELQVRINGREEILREDQIPRFNKGTINSQGNYVMMHGERGSYRKENVYFDPSQSGEKRYGTSKKKGEDIKKIRVPVYPFPAGKSDAQDIDQYSETLEDFARSQALEQAQKLTGDQMPKPKRNAINAKINEGSLQSFAGSIYELSLATLLTDDEFARYEAQTDTSNFDLNLIGQDKLKGLFDIKKKARYGEVKNKFNRDNLLSAGAKINRVLGGETGKRQKAQKNKLTGQYVSKAQAKAMGITTNRSSYQLKDSDFEKAKAYFGINPSSKRGEGGKMFLKDPPGKGGGIGLGRRLRTKSRGSLPNLNRSQVARRFSGGSLPSIRRFAGGSPGIAIAGSGPSLFFGDNGGQMPTTLEVDNLEVETIDANSISGKQTSLLDDAKNILKEETDPKKAVSTGVYAAIFGISTAVTAAIAKGGKNILNAGLKSNIVDSKSALAAKNAANLAKGKLATEAFSKGGASIETIKAAKDTANAAKSSLPKILQTTKLTASLLAIVPSIAGTLTKMYAEQVRQEKGDLAARNLSIAGGALEGAGLGATIGSIVPGPGNVIGAVIGSVLGAGLSYFSERGLVNSKKAAEEQKTRDDLDRFMARQAVSQMEEDMGFGNFSFDRSGPKTIINPSEYGTIDEVAKKLDEYSKANKFFAPLIDDISKQFYQTKLAKEGLMEGTEEFDKAFIAYNESLQRVAKVMDFANDGTFDKLSKVNDDLNNKLNEIIMNGASGSALKNPVFEESRLRQQMMPNLASIKGVSAVAAGQGSITDINAALTERYLKIQNMKTAQKGSANLSPQNQQALMSKFGIEAEDGETGSQALSRGLAEKIKEAGLDFTKTLKDGALELGKQQVKYAEQAAKLLEQALETEEQRRTALAKDVIDADTKPQISSQRVDSIIETIKDSIRSGDQTKLSKAFNNLNDETQGLTQGKEFEFLKQFGVSLDNPKVKAMLEKTRDSRVSGKGRSAEAVRGLLESNVLGKRKEELEKEAADNTAASEQAKAELDRLGKKAGLPSTQEFINSVQNVANQLSSIIGDVKKAEQIGTDLKKTNELVAGLVATTNEALAAQDAEIRRISGLLGKNNREIAGVVQSIAGKPSRPQAPQPQQPEGE